MKAPFKQGEKYCYDFGRDLVRAAVGAGSEGVKIHMDYLRQTLAKAMLMTGCPELASISVDILC